jgi:membrane protein
MRSRLRWTRFLSELHEQVRRDDVFNGATALGFYLTLALFPAMIFLMALIPYLPIAHVDDAIMDLLRQALPDGAARMFSGVVREVTGEQRGALLSLGIAGALWAASTGMYAIMQQLNIAFDVAERRPFLRARGTALILTVFFGMLVLAAFSLIVLGGVVQDWIGRRWGFSSALLDFFIVFRWVVIVLSLMLGLALVYHFAPNRRRRFKLISTGNVAATLLMIVALAGFSLYTSHFGNYSALYGSIGAVIVLMMSLYVSGLVILLGAEIDAMLERHAGCASGKVDATAGTPAQRRLGASRRAATSRRRPLDRRRFSRRLPMRSNAQ